jgi:hypothetical protein
MILSVPVLFIYCFQRGSSRHIEQTGILSSNTKEWVAHDGGILLLIKIVIYIIEMFCFQRDLFCSTLLLLQYRRMGGGQIITNTPEGKRNKTTNILSRLADKAYLLGFWKDAYNYICYAVFVHYCLSTCKSNINPKVTLACNCRGKRSCWTITVWKQLHTCQLFLGGSVFASMFSFSRLESAYYGLRYGSEMNSDGVAVNMIIVKMEISRHKYLRPLLKLCVSTHNFQWALRLQQA